MEEDSCWWQKAEFIFLFPVVNKHKVGLHLRIHWMTAQSLIICKAAHRWKKNCPTKSELQNPLLRFSCEKGSLPSNRAKGCSHHPRAQARTILPRASEILCNAQTLRSCVIFPKQYISWNIHHIRLQRDDEYLRRDTIKVTESPARQSPNANCGWRHLQDTSSSGFRRFQALWNFQVSETVLVSIHLNSHHTKWCPPHAHTQHWTVCLHIVQVLLLTHNLWRTLKLTPYILH